MPTSNTKHTQQLNNTHTHTDKEIEVMNLRGSKMQEGIRGVGERKGKGEMI